MSDIEDASYDETFENELEEAADPPSEESISEEELDETVNETDLEEDQGVGDNNRKVSNAFIPIKEFDIDDFKISNPYVYEEVRKLAIYRQYIMRTKKKTLNIPVNIKYIIGSVLQARTNEKELKFIKSRVEIAQMLEDFCEKQLVTIYGNNLPRINKLILNEALIPLKIAIRCELASKKWVNKITQDELNTIFNKILTFSMKAICSPGEAVGILAGASLGQPSTQLTLNTFHLSGVKSGLHAGMDRLQQVLNVTKTDKCGDAVNLTIYLKPSEATSLESVKNVIIHLDTNYLNDFIEKLEIIQDPEHKIDEEMFKMYEKYNKIENELSSLSLRIVLNEAKMYNKRLAITDIQIILRTNDPKLFIIHDGKSLMRVFILKSILGTNTNELDFFKKLIYDFETLTLTGIPKIKGFEYRKIQFPYRDNSGTIKMREEYVVETSGTNLKEILRSPEIDQERTFSNDIYETYQRFGIEACRNIIIYNLVTIFEANGIKVPSCHIRLLADAMTHEGVPTSVNRSGLEIAKVGICQQAFFEQANKVFAKAAIYSEVDKTNAISSNIFTNNAINCGTGFFKVARVSNQ